MQQQRNTGDRFARADNGGVSDADERPLRLLAVSAVDPSPYEQLESPLLSVRAPRRPEDAPEIAATWQPDLALIELELADPRAEDLVRRIRARHACPCALVLDTPDGEALTLAARAGFDALLLRPLERADLCGLVARERERRTPSGTFAKAVELPEVILGSSAPMQEVWRRVILSSRTHSPVVITGETGVGKEVVTRALHLFGTRRSGPFVAVNCAALPETLLESELFGHEKGAFTGATGQRKGRFELAHEGTLFLDEIGDLPQGVQVKLLRVLQEQVFERVGGTESIQVDVRVVAATHRDLEQEVRCGRFRADLFYRLNVFTIHVPPLRERKKDLLALWDRFVEEGAGTARRSPLGTSAAAHRRLMQHDWPGNVRQLYNAAHHALTVATGDLIMPADLPDDIAAQPQGSRSLGLAGLTMAQIEQAAILETHEALGSIKPAAAMLGISERKMQYRLREYREAGLLRASAQAPDARAASEPGRLRILLVEDDDELRWALTDFLRKEGHDVLQAADGSAVLVHLGASMLLSGGKDLPDAIVTDVRMPGLNGIKLLESVRARGWEIPVVVISAFGDDSVRKQATALGASAYFEKPLDIEALRALLRELSAASAAVGASRP
jgi:DNA-binding NtrC family response regulator